MLLPDFPANSAVSPLAFFFADLNPSVPGVDVVYVADDGNTAAGGGIQKFSLVGTTWTYNGTIAGGTGLSIRGLDGQVSAAVVVTLVASGSGLFFLNDNSGHNAAPSSGAVNLTNNNRVTTFGAVPAFGRGLADTRPKLHLELSNASAGRDEAYVYFEAGTTAGHDAEYDAAKLANPRA